MRIGILFHKNPCVPPTGIDLVRLRAVARGLMERGVGVDVIAAVESEALLDRDIPVKPLKILDSPNRYDLVKTCYHASVRLIGSYHGPVVSRIVRVVDERLPERDAGLREFLLDCQELIRRRSAAVVLNNEENAERWRRLYGDALAIVLVPTGCPSEIPAIGADPYPPMERVALFVGSLAAPRMVRLLNETARGLQGIATVHFVGLNKACMYGGDEGCTLDPLIVDHGERCETDVWDYVRHAKIGLAFATGPHPFDNDVSKILTYLRGGLPVLSEEPILNNNLVRQTGHGKIFAFDDVQDLVTKAGEMIQNPTTRDPASVMRFMAQEHSWERRVDTYVDLFRRIINK